MKNFLNKFFGKSAGDNRNDLELCGIENVRKIDSISRSPEGEICLSISDHLEWTGNIQSHFTLLQEKVTNYVNFILSGQLEKIAPDSSTSKKVIEVAFIFQPTDGAIQAFNKLREQVLKTGIDLRSERIPLPFISINAHGVNQPTN